MEEAVTSSHRDPADKHAEEAAGGKTPPQCSVISTYRAKIGGVPRIVTVVWSKNLMNHSLSVSIEKGSSLTCKVDLKPWPFRSKKGSKSFDVDGKQIDVSWNFRLAKFSDGPEPTEGYYVALVCDEEVVLLLGDRKKKAYKKTRSRPSLEEATLVSKKENVFGKKCFAARVRFDGRNKEHDIVVANSIAEHKDPEMWISIDGVILIHVNHLQWKFRGNETVWVEQVPVQVLWDVHDWLFRGPGSGHALFMFKPGLPALAAEEKHDGGDPVSSNTESSMVSSGGGGDDGSPEFCFFLYAWKME
ncbi:uncharacterized protein LOC135637149 [Musa acuminata AAA Group]|uniref:(wild Malaysian banana) hypothetical protein n=1 Tax=Musa acuminata subsp. malaccensis TaxID=214687 RepID=A0A804HMD3_MUSAM|nr:PREDICTED: uncharacterized protein LOC103974443 [Musa acuminata subsp. malaccensis]CAG1850249.1 unnamed protein product [Musa acuminata subsp. malaccensis]